jgi:hypothetical protein
MEDFRMLMKQNPILTYACLDTDFVDGYPPTTYSGVEIRNDSICEVMNTTTKQIYSMYKMYAGVWYDYVIGETAGYESLYIQWVGYPESPMLTSVYPSQVIVNDDDIIKLYGSTQSIQYFLNSSIDGSLNTTPNFMEDCPKYHLLDGDWILADTEPINPLLPPVVLLKSNRDIINMQSGFVIFPKSI